MYIGIKSLIITASSHSLKALDCSRIIVSFHPYLCIIVKFLLTQFYLFVNYIVRGSVIYKCLFDLIKFFCKIVYEKRKCLALVIKFLIITIVTKINSYNRLFSTVTVTNTPTAAKCNPLTNLKIMQCLQVFHYKGPKLIQQQFFCFFLAAKSKQNPWFISGGQWTPLNAYWQFLRPVACQLWSFFLATTILYLHHHFLL